MLLEENISLKQYNTFGIDVKARYFANITDASELNQLFNNKLTKELPLLILGGGSNLLFTKDFEGLVVKISIDGISNKVEGDNVIVSAGAGVVWNDLVRYSVNNGFAGMENLSLIPGTVGASPVQNIGAYGVELKDVFQSCTAFNMETHQMEEFGAVDCAFGYRESIFKQAFKGKYIITQVRFNLNLKAKLNTSYGAIGEALKTRGINEPKIRDVADVVAEIRVSKLPDPSTIGNAGSFFKNPVISAVEFNKLHDNFPAVVHYPAGAEKEKVAAGWLIEQCGFKGVVSGNTGTWKNQSLVLVNHGGATGMEVYNFSETIINSVYSKFGIRLEREVNIL